MKKLLFLLLACLLLCTAALADEARDITKDCTINNRAWTETSPGEIRDEDHETWYEGYRVTIAAPEGEKIAALLIQWQVQPGQVVLLNSADGENFKEMFREECKYAQQLVFFDTPQSIIRFKAGNGDKIEVNELTVLTEGDIPSWVPQWKDPPEKVDLMLFSTHPDDEVLWFGGMLPYYAGERDKEILVINAVFNSYRRKLELLDALWTCGMDNYPVFCRYVDVYTGTVAEVRKQWHARPYSTENGPTELIRRYKPDVVVGHDVNGEYGHVAHRLFSLMTREGVLGAANPDKHWQSAKEYGLWEVPKTYLHLWGENQIHMDWHQPLTAFGGKTGIEVAAEALECHVSQMDENAAWQMSDVDGGKYDNGLFGLWRSNVGPDVEKNDLFENIPGN